MCPAAPVPSVQRMNTSNAMTESDRSKTAIVTGASRGLGQALAAGLAAAGYALVIDARDGIELEAARSGLAAQHRGTVVTAVPGDVGDPAHRAALVRAADRTGGADLLINNAGTLGANPLPALADYPLDELRAALESNVVAPVALIQALLPALRQRGGAILNITSDAATGAYTGWGGYGAAKAALEQASNVLAAEENTVRVWWVDPGDLRTRMHQQAFPGEDISDRPLPEQVVPGFLRLITGRLPSGRYRAAELLPGLPADLPADLSASA
jgi:NAD(P)-dependent dehydrogenase (short-subunit alcohol dehydrogenase family)